jgi:hypothetical protein
MKKAYNLLLCSLILSTLQLSSQDCPDNPVVFTVQAQVDAFKDAYPNCTEMDYSITVQGAGIHNLAGLSNLQIINGDFTIVNCDSLEDFKGLESLEQINGEVRFQNNIGLKSFDGLSGLRIFGGEYLYISRSPLIKSFSGLSQLERINGDFNFFDLDSLTDLSGLDGLELIQGSLNISRNNSLVSLDGIENLLEIVGDLRIQDNMILQSIESLNRPVLIGEWLVISNNPMLSACSVEGVCNHFVLPNGNRAFGGNADGCRSEQEVWENCISSSKQIGLYTFLNVYPNPVQSILIIETDEMPDLTDIQVFSLLGKSYVVSISGHTISVENLPAGIYFGSFEAADQRYLFRFIKL